MSWSLRLTDGDFALSGSQFDTVNDFDKLAQDLRCCVLEKMGTDDMHPAFGSLINGGVTPDGTRVSGALGLFGTQAAQQVQAEIQRICANYQSQQLARAKDDRTTYNRVSLTPGEVLLSITDIQLKQNQDSLDVLVKLSTATGEDVSIALNLVQ